MSLTLRAKPDDQKKKNASLLATHSQRLQVVLVAVFTTPNQPGEFALAISVSNLAAVE